MFNGFDVGDEVEACIDNNSRAWGYNPIANGVKGKIVGFAPIAYGRTQNFGRRPGIYLNRNWVQVDFENGEQHCLNSCNVKHVDAALHESRYAAYRALSDEGRDSVDAEDRIGDLPETPFIEGDIVDMADDFGYHQGKVMHIEYLQLGMRYPEGAPICTVSVDHAGQYSTYVDNRLVLVERGNVWKREQGLPLVFADTKEEAAFYADIGRTKELRNPANGLYKWTKDEILDAIQNGTAHGFCMSSGFFGGGPTPYAVRFLDEEVGKRVAEYTLKGFAVEAPAE